MPPSMTVGDLVAYLKLDDSDFNRKLDANHKKFLGTGSALNNAANVGAVGFGVLSAAIIKSTADYMAYGAEIRQTERSTGANAQTASKLVGEWKRYGVETTAATMGTKKLMMAIDGARSGNASAAKDFEDLGISVDKLKSMNDTEAIDATRNALAGMAAGAERSRIATDLLGRGSIQMSAWYSASADSMMETDQKLKDAGLIWSDEQEKKYADAVKADAELKIAMMGLEQTIAQEVLPAIDPLINFLSDTLDKMGPLAKAIPFVTLALGGFVAVVKINNALRSAWGDTFGRLIPKLAAETTATEAETAALGEQTAAIEENTIARGENGAAALGGGAEALAGGGATMAAGAIGTGTAGMGAGSAVAGGGVAAMAGAVAGIIGTLAVAGAAAVLVQKLVGDWAIGDGTGAAKVKTYQEQGATFHPAGGKGGAVVLVAPHGSTLNWEDAKSRYDPLISSSHAQTDATDKSTAATKENTAAVKDSTASQKSLAQSILDDAAKAAGAVTQPMSNKEFLKYAATLHPLPNADNAPVPYVPTQKLPKRKAAHGAHFRTNGPLLLLVGDNPSGQEDVDVTPRAGGKPRGSGGGDTYYITVPIAIEKLIGTDARSVRQMGDKIEQRLARKTRYSREARSSSG